MDIDNNLSCIPGKPAIIPFRAEPDLETPITCMGKKYIREQLPLETAFSSTIHKAQGVTAKYGVVVHAGKAFAMGLFYVAFSRATSMDSILTLEEFSRAHFKTHPSKYLQIKTEMNRLRSLPPTTIPTMLISSADSAMIESTSTTFHSESSTR